MSDEKAKVPKAFEEDPEVKHVSEVTEDVPTRRVRFLMINPQDFLMLFAKGLVFAKRTQLITGLPEDAKLVSMTVDHVRGGIILVAQSDTYDEVPMTEMPPVQLVEIELGQKGATKKKRK